MKGVDPRWVLYALRSPHGRAEIERLATGNQESMRNIGQDRIRRIRIPLAPRAEQDRIVAEIEKQFTRLDVGVEALRRLQARLRRYRAAVMSAACEGRLVPTEAAAAREEHRHYESGRELRERLLALRRSCARKTPVSADETDLPRIPEGWAVASMDELTTHITSGSRDWSKYYGRGTGTFIMAQNVRPGRLDLSFKQPVDPPADDRDRARSVVAAGDLLVTIVGANTGDVCRVPRELPEHYVCQSVALMRPVDATISPFLDAYMNSAEHGQRQYKRYIYGQGRPHLSFDQLRATPVLLPPIAEQRRIVAALEQRMSQIHAVEVTVAHALARADRLRSAVLKAAFDGRLVRDEPAARATA
jgi:type I restriction enzyme, S subunit